MHPVAWKAINRRLRHRCFAGNFEKVSRTTCLESSAQQFIPQSYWLVQSIDFRSQSFLVDFFSISVFLTSICRMPTWLPTWKAKSLYHVGTFLPTWFFLPLEKFKTIKIKPEKDPYTQTNTCLLHMSRNFKEILKYICFTLYLQQTVSNWKSAIVFMDRRCLPCFFQ